MNDQYGLNEEVKKVSSRLAEANKEYVASIATLYLRGGSVIEIVEVAFSDDDSLLKCRTYRNGKLAEALVRASAIDAIEIKGR